MPDVDTTAFDALVDETVHDRSLVGLAVGVVGNGHVVYRKTVGKDSSSSTQAVTQSSHFRLASISKTLTAIAVMQLVEQGRLTIDDLANDHLTSIRLQHTGAKTPPVLIRHLLTHSAGLTEPLRWRDARPSRVLGPKVGRPVPSISSMYAPVMRPHFEPGTRWMYSNDGFAVLGQLVEDVAGRPLGEHLTVNVLQPLGMTHTVHIPGPADLAARGHRIKRGRVKQTVPRNVPNLAAGGWYSTLEDMLAYSAHLGGILGGQHPEILSADTFNLMCQPAVFLGDRVPFQGLCFFLDEEDGHRTVFHGGDYPGYEAALFVAPDDGMAVVVLTNTSAQGAAQRLARRLLRSALGLPTSLPIGHPEAKLDDRLVPELTGSYAAGRGSRNLRLLALTGGRLTVRSSGGQLTMRGRLGPLRRPVLLEPADPADTLRFRFLLRSSLYDEFPIDVVFARDAHGHVRWLDLGLIGARLTRS